MLVLVIKETPKIEMMPEVKGNGEKGWPQFCQRKASQRLKNQEETGLAGEVTGEGAFHAGSSEYAGFSAQKSLM